MRTAAPCYEYGTAVERIWHIRRFEYQRTMLIHRTLRKHPQNSLICKLGTFILKRRHSHACFFFAFLYKWKPPPNLSQGGGAVKCGTWSVE